MLCVMAVGFEATASCLKQDVSEHCYGIQYLWSQALLTSYLGRLASGP